MDVPSCCDALNSPNIMVTPWGVSVNHVYAGHREVGPWLDGGYLLGGEVMVQRSVLPPLYSITILMHHIQLAMIREFHDPMW